MNTFKQLLLTLYRSWLLISIVLLIASHFILGVSWAVTVMTPLTLILIFTLISTIPSLSFLRWITWPLVREGVCEKVLTIAAASRAGVCATLPFEWIDTKGKEIYTKEGDAALRQALTEAIYTMPKKSNREE